jgi:hypothetical protein
MHTLGCTFSSNYNKVSTCNLIYESYNVCLSDRQGRAGRADIFSYWPLFSWSLSSSANSNRAGQGRAGKKTWEILGYGFQNMVFRTWDLNFGTWEILGYGFQDMVFKTWDLNFGAWEILGYGLQDMAFKTWDLNFGAWIFTLVISKTET